MFFLNGIINIEFNNVQDLNYVQENWNSFDDFPNSSVISLNQLKNKNNFCNIIIRDVPLNLTDAEILNDLKLNCEKLQSVQRFIKKGKPLPIVKLTFKDESNINEIINSGIYINNMFFQPEILTEVRKPSRCFNCWGIGHHSGSCKKNSVCKNCGNEDHRADACSNSSKCVNCKKNHSANDSNCPVYQTSLRKLNNLN